MYLEDPLPGEASEAVLVSLPALAALHQVCRGGEHCCQRDNQCGEGEGDCNTDEECAGMLECGDNNCGDQVSVLVCWSVVIITLVIREECGMVMMIVAREDAQWTGHVCKDR